MAGIQDASIYTYDNMEPVLASLAVREPAIASFEASLVTNPYDIIILIKMEFYRITWS